MPIFEYQCAENTVTEIFMDLGWDPARTVSCDCCGTQASRKYSVPAVSYDGGSERFHNTTLKEERDKAERRIKNITDAPGSQYKREHFQYKNTKRRVG